MSSPDLNLTEHERLGIVSLRANVMRAKAALCDAQHDLQRAQTVVEEAQRSVALHEQALSGAVIAYAYARGLTEGNVSLSEDGTRLIR